MGTTRNARDMTRYPAIAEAIRNLEQDKSEIRGSLMTLKQRREFTLDNLVSVASEKSNAARVRALELIGKSAGLFNDDTNQVVKTGDTDDIRQRITELLTEVKQRRVDGAIDVTPDSNTVEQRVNSGDRTD